MKYLIHCLTKVDLANRTGVFRYRTNVSTHWIQYNVSLSPILASRIADRKSWDKLPVNVPYLKHEFQTTVNSPLYEDSPFRLVKFVPDGKTDAPLNYHLEAVDEWGSEIYDDDLEEVIGYKSGWRKAKDFIRREVRKINKMLSDMEEGTIIVQPDIKKVLVK